ncbi:MAG: tetratricopeptide repeat protein [Flavobacteriales bacterium]|nr:tetratricopeptide repeat protein [Flavobacteriales bacterium]
MKKGIFIILCFLSVQTFAQWKSYYPEGTKRKTTKKEKNKETEKGDTKFKFDSHFYNALSLKSLENYDDALLEFEKCININPENPVPFYESAIIYKLFSQVESALEFSKKAYYLNKENIWFQLLYAELLTSNGQNTKAAIIYKQLIKKYPGNEEYYYLLADNYIYSRRFSEAIKIYNQLEKHKGLDKNIIIQKQKLYLENKNLKGAISEIKKLIEINKNDINAYETLSELYLLNNETDKAFEIFKKILELDPEDAKVHLTLADYYREQGDNEKSYKELKAAFSSPKLSIDIKVNILISYYSLIEFSEQMKNQAMELCEILVKTHEGNPIANAIYGDFLYQDGQNLKAKAQYKRVIELDENRPQVWSQLLFIESELEDNKELESDSEKAFQLFPSNPVYYFFNGIANSRLKNHKKAIISLEMGLEFVIETPALLVQFYSTLGDNYHSLKKHQKSDSLYNLALAFDPDNVQILNNFSYYLSLRNQDLEKASEMSKKSNELSPDNASFQDTYAWILYQQKNYKEAKIWLEKAYKNGGKNSPVITEHFGDIYFKLGDKEQAIIFWKKAKELGDGSKYLEKKIAEKTLYE